MESLQSTTSHAIFIWSTDMSNENTLLRSTSDCVTVCVCVCVQSQEHYSLTLWASAPRTHIKGRGSHPLLSLIPCGHWCATSPLVQVP